VERCRPAIALCYCLAVITFLVGYYLSVRGSSLHASVDSTSPLLGLALLSLLVGITLGRSWVLLLPLVAMPAALSLFMLASVDDRYRDAAPASGAPISAGEWAGYAAVALAATVPAVAAGVLLVSIARQLGGPSRSRPRPRG
jgi:hypothetical protein